MSACSCHRDVHTSYICPCKHIHHIQETKGYCPSPPPPPPQVISAISSCRPIVTLAWLEAAVRCMKSKQVFPDCAGYLPPVVDANIKDTMDSSAFKPNLKRTELFKGLTFYFLTEKQVPSSSSPLLSPSD